MWHGIKDHSINKHSTQFSTMYTEVLVCTSSLDWFCHAIPFRGTIAKYWFNTSSGFMAILWVWVQRLTTPSPKKEKGGLFRFLAPGVSCCIYIKNVSFSSYSLYWDTKCDLFCC